MHRFDNAHVREPFRTAGLRRSTIQNALRKILQLGGKLIALRESPHAFAFPDPDPRVDRLHILIRRFHCHTATRADDAVGRAIGASKTTAEAAGAADASSSPVVRSLRTCRRELGASSDVLRKICRKDFSYKRTPHLEAVQQVQAARCFVAIERVCYPCISFNVKGGRCPTCEGEGFVCVELLFMPSVYAPCPACHGTRYQESTLRVSYRGKNIADVLAFSVDEADEFFAAQPGVHRPLKLLRDIGLGYLRLGQPATELSGGEAQRVKLATELQRVARGATLYIIDEPTIGLHPADVDKLMIQLQALVDGGNTVMRSCTVAAHPISKLARPLRTPPYP